MKSPDHSAVSGVRQRPERPGWDGQSLPFQWNSPPIVEVTESEDRLVSHSRCGPSNTSGWEANVSFPVGSGEEGGLVLHLLAEYRVTSAPVVQ